jgi:hypothetical protein
MNGVGIAAAVILGPVGVLLLVAIVLRIRAQRHAPDWRVTRLADLDRVHVDPHWDETQQRLDGAPPPSWDPCVTKRPHQPEDPQQGEDDDR